MRNWGAESQCHHGAGWERPDRPLLALQMEGSHKRGMGAASGSGKRQKNKSSPRASRKKWSPANTWILASQDPLWTSDLQNCKIINLCCVMTLNVWYLVTEAIENKYRHQKVTAVRWGKGKQCSQLIWVYVLVNGDASVGIRGAEFHSQTLTLPSSSLLA